MRRKIQMNDGWEFVREGQKPVKVSIPHTWNAIDGANGFDYYKGECIYKKDFFIEKSDEANSVFLEFEGSNSVTDVYVNGRHLGQHRGGYSTFRFDVTKTLKFGEMNDLEVRVDNTVFDDVYPQMADFTFYGGLYRDVNLVITNPIHFDLMDYGSQGIYIIQKNVTDEVAELEVRTRISNDSDEDKKVRIWIDINDADGQKVIYGAKEVILSPKETKTESLDIKIEKPKLWDGKKDAHMYKGVCSLTAYNDTIDSLEIPFGTRYFHVDAEKGFFLNGKHLPLNGVSRHQDRKDMGWAITSKEQDEDMALIKEVGATSIRLAHYQHNQYFYDLCDREGMIVWAEIPFISIMSKTETEGINPKLQLKELIRQNFNHPSIMFWGVQNEIQIGGDRPEVRKVVKELNEIAKAEDPTRLTTMANVMFVEDEDEYNFITDTVGYNKYYGWYTGKTEDFGPWIDEFHKKNPGVKLGISEYGSEGIIQYHNDDPKVKDYSEEYHALYHETVWKIFKDRPFLWSTYVWNMFDFGANIRDEGGVKGRNNKGLVTYDRKIKKDAFYLYKAYWSEEKFVHIAGKRYVDRPGRKMDVKVYSNCDKVSLAFNGVEISFDEKDEKIFIFKNIELKDGYNIIKAVAVEGENKYTDTGVFNRVDSINESYQAPEQSGGVVANWFETPNLDDVEIEDIEISDAFYSTNCSFGELFENPETKKIMDRFFPGFEDHPMFGMAQGMKIDQIAEMAPEKFDDKLLYSLNKELIKIKK
ncbi:glycoside hydrolase family 2 protein [Alkalibacter saccharofermentans]|uniref:Beta-galactosidase n=1 Tax=Alkalibacter saccharofermentans DSM 14828 TaxID=1120975 RepID=A0A1M4W245_9FIRM|nr:glycoside hydrolase family 2 TIM barrel-domain containing protein [Alkalibacter saccharofermentans]SHE75235.1 beta-galactosidase [Alkalibacter saccharofermentans DSM 14828]